ncbi:MAG: hypothetical protein K0S47_3634 [Herbinix sp.]|jgi:hypothetical protein|nr:hypothetical protein [Herbinix sp.]
MIPFLLFVLPLFVLRGGNMNQSNHSKKVDYNCFKNVKRPMLPPHTENSQTSPQMLAHNQMSNPKYSQATNMPQRREKHEETPLAPHFEKTITEIGGSIPHRLTTGTASPVSQIPGKVYTPAHEKTPMTETTPTTRKTPSTGHIPTMTPMNRNASLHTKYPTTFISPIDTKSSVAKINPVHEEKKIPEKSSATVKQPVTTNRPLTENNKVHENLGIVLNNPVPGKVPIYPTIPVDNKPQTMGKPATDKYQTTKKMPDHENTQSTQRSVVYDKNQTIQKSPVKPPYVPASIKDDIWDGVCNDQWWIKYDEYLKKYLK